MGTTLFSSSLLGPFFKTMCPTTCISEMHAYTIFKIFFSTFGGHGCDLYHSLLVYLAYV